MRFSWAIHDVHSEQRNYLPHFRSWWLDFIFIFDCENNSFESWLLSFYFIIFPFGNKFTGCTWKDPWVWKPAVQIMSPSVVWAPWEKSPKKGHCVRSILRTLMRAELWKQSGKGKSWRRSELGSSNLVCCCRWCWSVDPTVSEQQRPRGRALLLTELFRLSLSMATMFPVGMDAVALVAWEYIC